MGEKALLDLRILTGRLIIEKTLSGRRKKKEGYQNWYDTP